MNKSRKFSWSSSTPSHLVPFRVGIESEDSSQCCFCCCNFHLKKAAILIAFLDIFMQCTQMYRNGEVYFLISKCKSVFQFFYLKFFKFNLKNYLFFNDVQINGKKNCRSFPVRPPICRQNDRWNVLKLQPFSKKLFLMQ